MALAGACGFFGAVSENTTDMKEERIKGRRSDIENLTEVYRRIGFIKNRYKIYETSFTKQNECTLAGTVFRI